VQNPDRLINREADMAAQHDLTYAQRDGRLVSISQVGRGLRPDCRCPACGGALIAKKGDVRRHHFAHASGQDCETAAESALHRLAKQLICTPGTRLALPEYHLEHVIKSERKPQRLREHVPGVGGRVISVASGVEEQRFEGLTADAVIEVAIGQGRPPRSLIVEIAVTHPSGKAKIRRLRRNGVPAVEVELSRVLSGRLSMEEGIRQALLDPQRVRWLFHPSESQPRQRLAARVRRVRASDQCLHFASRKDNGSSAPVASSHWTGWDRCVADHEARNGPLTIEAFSRLQDRYFRWKSGRINRNA
jgi:hypothetical protein